MSGSKRPSWFKSIHTRSWPTVSKHPLALPSISKVGVFLAAEAHAALHVAADRVAQPVAQGGTAEHERALDLLRLGLQLDGDASRGFPDSRPVITWRSSSVSRPSPLASSQSSGPPAALGSQTIVRAVSGFGPTGTTP